MKHKISIILFWLVQSYVIAQVSDFKHIDFTKANNIAKLNEGAKLDDLPILAYQLTHKLSTDVEKFRAIYSWVCHNIKGDNVQHDRVSIAQQKYKGNPKAYLQWNDQYKVTAFRKLMKSKKTMCTGYAYLIRELCTLANIDCKIINGYSRSVESNITALEIVNHSWNTVKLNNKWYLCDATWSSGYIDDYNSFVAEYNDGYFLTEPAFFAKTHFPTEQDWLLTTQITAQHFTQAPLIYGEAYKHNIHPTNSQKMTMTINKGDTITFSFTSPHFNYSKAISMVRFAGQKEYKLSIDNLKYDKKTLSFTYQFKHKGKFDAHIKINDDIIATYTIKVNKKKIDKNNKTASL
jgi:transglutaminase/protease-like cytokinesis protein 3